MVVPEEQHEEWQNFVLKGHKGCASCLCEIWIVDGTQQQYSDYPLWLQPDSKIPMRTLLMFEYGKSKEGYYDTTEFIQHAAISGHLDV